MKKAGWLFSLSQETAAFPFAPVRYGVRIFHAGKYKFKHFLFHRESPPFFTILNEGVIHLAIRDVCRWIRDEQLPVEPPDPVKFPVVIDQRSYHEVFKASGSLIVFRETFEIAIIILDDCKTLAKIVELLLEMFNLLFLP
jgi:hypothetical protein